MKNIDIVKVKKTELEKTQSFYKPQRVNLKNTRSITKKKLGYGLGFAFIQGIKAPLRSNVFFYSFLRNIFDLKPLFFVAIPLVYFEVLYFFVLKPDQVLNSIKNFVSPQNTFQFVGFGLVLILVIIISSLMDTFVTSALYRYNYQKIDSRNTKVSENIREVLKSTGPIINSKLSRLLVLIPIIFLYLALIYLSFILGLGSLSYQLTLYLLVTFLVLSLYLIYTKFRYTTQNAASIGLGVLKGKLSISFKLSFFKPVRSYFQSFVWLLMFILFFTASSALSYFVVKSLSSNQSVTLSVVFLTLFTFGIYTLWSLWTAFNVGYWSGITNYERDISKFTVSTDKDSDYFAFWILIIAILVILIAYFVLSFVFSSRISEYLVKIWEALPDSAKLNIPKPN